MQIFGNVCEMREEKKKDWEREGVLLVLVLYLKYIDQDKRIINAK